MFGNLILRKAEIASNRLYEYDDKPSGYVKDEWNTCHARH